MCLFRIRVYARYYYYYHYLSDTGQYYFRIRQMAGACITCAAMKEERRAAATSGQTISQNRALTKLAFHFLSHSMGYDRGDSFAFHFEPNGIPFGSKSKGKLSVRSYHIQCERKWKHSFLGETTHGPTNVKPKL